ncbi:MAG: M15 family metallopeptidase [Georgenia sp.]
MLALHRDLRQRHRPAEVDAVEPTAPASPGESARESSEALPPFRAVVTTVDAADLHSSWRPGCPVGPEDLRAIDAPHWGYDGAVHTGRLIVAADLTDPVEAVLGELCAARFPVERMTPVEAYGGDDNAGMAANDTSAFNCRPVTGGSSRSEHSDGRAVDVNPPVNPYVDGTFVAPPEGAAYLDRDGPGTGMIRADDATVETFATHGWVWGGTWDSPKDYQHLSTAGR